MQNNYNSTPHNSQEIFTALRDIIDVLYDGYCKTLRDEELCSTVMKKIKEIRNCSEREKEYKMLRVFNILNSFRRSSNYNCNSNREVVLSILDEINLLCKDIIEKLDE